MLEFYTVESPAVLRRGLGLAASLALVACAKLPSNVQWACGADSDCPSAQSCGADHLCHPNTASDGGANLDGGNHPDAGADAGPTDGGPACDCTGRCGPIPGCNCAAPCPAGQTCQATYCAAPEVCTQGWCWETPWPQGNTLESLWAASPNELWAVGEGGTALHWIGGVWSSVPSSTTLDLHAVAGTSASNVWAAGDNGTVIHWDGLGWQPWPSVTGNALRSVSISDAGTVWLVGDSQALLTVIDGGIAPASAAGLGPSFNFNAVWAFSDQNVYAGGDQFAQWDGIGWSAIQSATAPFTIHGLWGSPSGAVYVSGASGLVGRFFDGGYAQTSVPGLPTLFAVSGNDDNDVWAAGTGGAVFHYTSTGTWTQSVAGRADDFLAVVATPLEVWAAGLEGALSERTSAGQWQTIDQGPRTALRGISGLGQPVFAVGDDQTIVQRRPDQTWALVADGGAGLTDVSVLSPSDAWAVGRMGTILHWNGTTWTDQSNATLPDLAAVYVQDANDVWVGGYLGVADELVANALHPYAVSGQKNVSHFTQADQLYAATSAGYAHFDGGGWVDDFTTALAPITTAWTGASGTWFAGSAGELYLLADGGLSPALTLPAVGPNLTAGASVPGGPDWVLGEQWFAFFREDGAFRFAPVPRVFSGTSLGFFGAWAGTSGQLWASGANGTVLRFDPPSCSNNPGVCNDFENGVASGIWSTLTSDGGINLASPGHRGQFAMQAQTTLVPGASGQSSTAAVVEQASYTAWPRHHNVRAYIKVETFPANFTAVLASLGPGNGSIGIAIESDHNYYLYQSFSGLTSTYLAPVDLDRWSCLEFEVDISPDYAETTIAASKDGSLQVVSMGGSYGAPLGGLFVGISANRPPLTENPLTVYFDDVRLDDRPIGCAQ